MKALRIVFASAVGTLVVSMLCLVALIIWGAFASGDCAMWVIDRLPMISDTREVFGQPYVPSCRGPIATAFHGSALGTLIGALIAALTVALAPTSPPAEHEPDT